MRSSSVANTMLLDFQATNARSFRDAVELTFLGNRLGDPGITRQVPWRDGGRAVEVLPVIGVFGPNASGKTNLQRIMDDMRWHVLNSFRLGEVDGGITRHDFKLREGRAAEPTSYAVRVVLDGVRHDYGFTLDDEVVSSEWAYRFPHGKEQLLFERGPEGDVEVGTDQRAAGQAVTKLLRPNALYLSTAAQAGYEPLLALFVWFRDNMLLASSFNRPLRMTNTIARVADSNTRRGVMRFMHQADLGIVDVQRRKPAARELSLARSFLRVMAEDDIISDEMIDDDAIADEFARLKLVHAGQDGQSVELEVDEESQGTLVWLALIGPVLEALQKGTVLLVDELDASLHPRLVDLLVGQFQHPESNPHNAQLVFNAFDPSLLGETADRRLARDQVYFTEKLSDGASWLYRLSDFSPRKHENIAKGYREGRYGASPAVTCHDIMLAEQDEVDAPT